MAIRNPNPSINVPKLNDIEMSSPIQWYSLKCKLVTPMYGGGVTSTVVDTDMPIRVTGIRGQLRFWWRLLAKQKWFPNLSNDDIRQKEFALWGGMTDGDEDGKASLVLLKITDVPTKRVIENNLKDYDDRAYSGLKYVLFPAYNETDERLKPHKLLDPSDNINWTLEFAFTEKINDTQKNQVIETLQWWVNFGGLGFRTRKGLGAVQITQSDDFPQIMKTLTIAEVASANCQLVQKHPSNDPMIALQTTIQKLNDFRQKGDIGRNVGSQPNRPGRSRWPEPDALRRITNSHASLHAPEHPAGNVFPRSLFGLPIMYHFVGRGEPSDVNLMPTEGERLASPLILRAVYDNVNEKWLPSALLLPYQHILSMEVTVNNNDYPIWQVGTARHIRPIQDNLPSGSVNPLTAFLTYFAQ